MGVIKYQLLYPKIKIKFKKLILRCNIHKCNNTNFFRLSTTRLDYFDSNIPFYSYVCGNSFFVYTATMIPSSAKVNKKVLRITLLAKCLSSNLLNSQ